MGGQKIDSLKLLVVIQLFFWLRVGVIDPVLVLFIRRIGITVTQIGLLMMVNSVGWAVFEPIFGVVADRIGKKRLIIYSIASTSLVYVSYTFATSIWHFALIMFAMSSNMAAGVVSIRAMMMDLLPTSGIGKVYGRYNAIVAMGNIIGPLLGGFLADTVSYFAPFYVSGGLGIICLATVLPLRYNERPISKASLTMKTLDRSKLMTKPFMGILFTRLVYMFNMNFQRSILPIFLHESQSFRASEVEIGFYMGIMRFTTALSQLFLGTLADKVGSKKLIVSDLAIGGLSYLSLIYLNEVPFLYLLGALQGIFFAAVDMSMMLYLMTITPKDSSGKAMGVYGLSEDIGGMISSPTLGMVYERIGPLSAIFFISTVLICNAIFSISLIKKDSNSLISSSQPRT